MNNAEKKTAVTAPGTVKPAVAVRDGDRGSPGHSSRELRALVHDNTVGALQTVLEIMQTGKPQERLKAAEIVLDRAHGKPTQPIDADVSGKTTVEIILPPGLDDLSE